MTDPRTAPAARQFWVVAAASLLARGRGGSGLLAACTPAVPLPAGAAGAITASPYATRHFASCP